ncbi:unnamed protein product [Didymodactylos carnosus]|uniref:Uncharacterized protein n=1 Tax=Didymodactylos carnosus TaxID=1234261 RepID=A0A815K1W0_9BILA|nr:unnamed protein product [Didymodactylos carnosus]CAF1387493.1 unnamed protein product [Didymodactylos carnosus]CAF4186517.1 unnamed protein product [Didymodactylos carnosus]CAF4282286.1 unnamed protein product [Didymodactylos carnosus]
MFRILQCPSKTERPLSMILYEKNDLRNALKNFEKTEQLIKSYYTNKKKYLFTTSTNKQIVNENFEETINEVCLKILTMNNNCLSRTKILHNVGCRYQKRGNLNLVLQSYN